MNVKNWFIAGLLVAATCPIGCTPAPYWPVAPTHQIAPLPEYREWYDEAEACRGLTGLFDVITFYVVNDMEGANEFYPEAERQGIVGLHSKNRIFLLEGLEADESTVKHEMLHNILQYYISLSRNAAHDDSLSFFGENACDLSP